MIRRIYEVDPLTCGCGAQLYSAWPRGLICIERDDPLDRPAAYRAEPHFVAGEHDAVDRVTQIIVADVDEKRISRLLDPDRVELTGLAHKA
jgi:hypothetical protein